MTPKFLRLIYVFEFLIALLSIFTAWSEIGGQAALDGMHWGWKLGLSVSLASAIVAYTAAITGHESAWSFRSALWLTAIIFVTIALGIVTYFYAMQEDNGDTDESGTISTCLPALPVAIAIS